MENSKLGKKAGSEGLQEVPKQESESEYSSIFSFRKHCNAYLKMVIWKSLKRYSWRALHMAQILQLTCYDEWHHRLRITCFFCKKKGILVTPNMYH